MNIKYILVFVFGLCGTISAKRADRPAFFEITTEDELQAYIQNKTKQTLASWSFKKLGQFFLPYDINEDILCSLCPLAIEGLIFERQMGMTDVQIEAEVVYFCQILGIENDRVCQGVTELNAPIIFYIIDNVPNISPKDVCSLLLETYSCPNANNVDWSIDVPSGKTDKKNANGTKTLKIAHLTDLHYEPLYIPGKTTNCGEPVCCQFDQADATDDSDRCGHWGSYTSSDTPLHTIESAVKSASSQNVDLVYMTGDVVSHRVWQTSVKGNTDSINTIYDMFHKYFNDTPIYFTLGNHEGHPVNTFSAESVNSSDVLSSSWLYNLFLNLSTELNSDDVSETILKGGYYTTSPRDGLRLIVLNDNVCSIENWWVFANNYDQYSQLGWMVETLQLAEKNKESVHILLHIYTQGCLKTWAREYKKIIARFANTVVGQFFGHTHKDEFYVYYDPSTSKPVNVGWNGASVMPDRSNPSYKIYEVDAETFQILNIEEWTFNLTEANKNPEAELDWQQLYSFKDDFGITSFDPVDIDALVVKMAENHDLIDTFYKYKFRNSDYMNYQGCNEACQKNILCTLVSTEFGDTKRCQELLAIYDKNKN